MIAGFRSIQHRKLNVVHSKELTTLYNVKDQKLISINTPGIRPPIGVASLPLAVRRSRFFTGSDLFRFSKLKSLPTNNDVLVFIKKYAVPVGKDDPYYHRRSKNLLSRNDVDNAFLMALIPELI